MSNNILAQLVAMANELGDPALDYAILGEGNASARADGDTFWVKASGAEMRTSKADDFVQVRFDQVLALLENSDVNDQVVKAGLEVAKVDSRVVARPSVETVLHAVGLQAEGIHFIGHTHPTAVNAVLCSRKAEEAIAGRLYPDEIVYCGVAPLYIPYTDPGVPLARALRDSLTEYQNQYGANPKVILMQNHGLIALGRTALEVQNVTAMYVKAARVLIGTYALGGPSFLSTTNVERIHGRPDEQYRQKFWGRT